MTGVEAGPVTRKNPRRGDISSLSNISKFAQAVNMKEYALNDEVEKYFRSVNIGSQKFSNFTRFYTVPYIMLFLNKTYRLLHLINIELDYMYGENFETKDENVKKYERLLLSDAATEKYFRIIVRKIGKACEENKINPFMKTALSVTPKSENVDGERIVFYLDTTGKLEKPKFPKNATVIDLTETYMNVLNEDYGTSSKGSNQR